METCRIGSGSTYEKFERMKKIPKLNTLKYNEILVAASPSNKVQHMIWNDNAAVLFQANCNNGSSTIPTTRIRPGILSTNAKIARAYFGDKHTREIDGPIALWMYNHNMNSVDIGNQLKSYYAGLRPIRMGGWKALWH